MGLPHNIEYQLPDGAGTYVPVCSVCNKCLSGILNPALCLGCDKPEHRLYAAIGTMCPCFPEHRRRGGGVIRVMANVKTYRIFGVDKKKEK